MRAIRTENRASAPELTPTLWRCPRCAALISIYSIENVDTAVCPICWDVTLDSLGNFETVLQISLP
jgi:hypothetical protein